MVERRDRHDPRLANISPFLSPSSLQWLADLGLVDELVVSGQPVREVVEYSAGGGRYVLDYRARSSGRFGYALSVPLLTLTGVLRDALACEASVTMSNGGPVAGVVDSGAGGIGLELVDGATVRSQLVVCADGKFSKVRAMAGIDAEVFEFDRPLVMMLVPLPVGWPQRIAAHHTDRDSLLSTIPLARNRMIVQWLPGQDEFERVRAADVGELRSRVARVVPEVAELLDAGVTEWEQVSIVRHHVVRPQVWSRGRIGLLGDAAHGVHSLGGQGLNLGIQDAVVLGSLLTEFGVNGDGAFAEYERLRKPFVERFQRYQLGLPQLTSQRDEGGGHHGFIYEDVADVMTSEQPEAAVHLKRLTRRSRQSA